MMDLSPHLVSGSCFLLCTPVCRPPAPSALVCSANLVTHTHNCFTHAHNSFAHSTFSQTHTHTQLFHTQLCHTHTHNPFTQLFLSQVCHTCSSFTHHFVTYNSFSLTHTKLSHIHLYHTHTALFHTICLPPSPLSFLPFPSHFHACFVLVGRS